MDYRAIQLATQMEMSSIEKTRKEMNRIVEIFKADEDYEKYIEYFAQENVRDLPKECFLNADSFFVPPNLGAAMLPLDLRDDALGFCRDGKCIFDGRFVYPVKDVKGDVMGWCGYDKFAEGSKYMDSKNYGYVAKATTLYGMEELPKYYRNDRNVYFIEGIVCCLYLRYGLLQAMAFLGSNLTPYVMEIVRRFGERAIVIPDSDASGNKLKQQLSYGAPKARILQSILDKDVDDSRKINPNLYKELQSFKWYKRTDSFV